MMAIKMKLLENKIKIFLFLTPFFTGLYYEQLSCAAAIVLLVFLLYDRKINGQLILPDTQLLLLTSSVSLLYGLSSLWAIDSGMALVGFSKFLVLPLFAFALAQQTDVEKQSLYSVLPLCGACMTAGCIVLSMIPALKDQFFVNSRLAGFFQYPNTFALFLLVGVIILIANGSRKPFEILQLMILLFGIAFSGSRTVFFLLLLSALGFVLFSKQARTRWMLVIACAVLILISIIFVSISGDLSALGRFLTTSLQSSTLQGRLLYWQDALPVILRHPLGLGYMGYSFLQGTFQTGVYSVTNVHNEWLQLALDIGWLPILLLIFVIFRTLFSKENDLTGRLLLIILSAHFFMDFDLQFPVIWFILVLVLDSASSQSKKITVLPVKVPAVILICFCLYFGAVSTLYHSGGYAACTRLYPRHTQALLAQLQQTDTLEDADMLADRILDNNTAVSLAWSAKARAAFSAGEISQMMDYKEKAIAHAKYSKEEYLDYFRMLYVGYQMYVKNGDLSSAEVCRQKLLLIPEQMNAVLENTAARAWKIQDIPDLCLPNEYYVILQSIQN